MNPQDPNNIAPPENVGAQMNAVPPISADQVVPVSAEPQLQSPQSVDQPAVVPVTVEQTPQSPISAQPTVSEAPQQPAAYEPVTPPAVVPTQPLAVAPPAVVSIAQAGPATVGAAQALSPIAPVPPPAPPAKSGKKKVLIIGVLLAVVVVIGAAGYLAYATLFGSKLSLETYEGDGYSILVPKDYTEKATDGQVDFYSEGPEEGRSGMSILSQDLPDGYSQSEIDETKELFFGGFDEDGLRSFASDDQTLEDVTIEDITFEGSDARRLAAEINEDGKKVGDVLIIVFFGETKFGAIMLYEHVDYPGILDASDKIFESFAFN